MGYDCLGAEKAAMGALSASSLGADVEGVVIFRFKSSNLRVAVRFQRIHRQNWRSNIRQSAEVSPPNVSKYRTYGNRLVPGMVLVRVHFTIPRHAQTISYLG